jgi:hypothetical protein
LDIAGILVELRAERARFDKAIKALESLESPRRDARKGVAKKAKPRVIRPIQLNQRFKSAQNLAEVIPIRSFGS